MELEPKELPAEEDEVAQHMKRLQSTTEEQSPEELSQQPEVIPPVLETQSEVPANNPLPDSVAVASPDAGPDAFVSRPEAHTSPETDQPFDIKNYPEWKNHWESWPAELRENLAPMIETGNLTPEIYQAIKVSFNVEDHDVAMDANYKGLGLKGVNVAAEAEYRTHTIRTYPELKRFSPEMQAHIVNHELGHFLGAHFVDPKAYEALVNNRPQNSMSEYMRKIGQKDPKEQLFEMLADDIADFLQSTTPEQMLSRRLSRVGDRPDLSVLTEDEKEAVIVSHESMLTESTELFAFLQLMLSKERQENPETALTESQQDKWLKTVGVLDHDLEEMDFDYDQQVPYDVAETAWQPPKKSKPVPPEQKQGMHLLDLLYAKG